MDQTPHQGSSREPIPPRFYSEYEERPFLTCTRCGETLKDFREGYQVAKIIKNGECTMEYAICSPCHEKMMEEFSDESRRNMEEFQSRHMNPDLGMDCCAICQTERHALGREEFALAGACEGTDLLHAIMICGACSEKMQGLVSKHTKGVWDKFVEDNFPGVPADALPQPGGVPMFT